MKFIQALNRIWVMPVFAAEIALRFLFMLRKYGPIQRSIYTTTSICFFKKMSAWSEILQYGLLVIFFHKNCVCDSSRVCSMPLEYSFIWKCAWCFLIKLEGHFFLLCKMSFSKNKNGFRLSIIHLREAHISTDMYLLNAYCVHSSHSS